MYSFNRNVLSVQLGALRVWECSMSKAAVVLDLRY